MGAIMFSGLRDVWNAFSGEEAVDQKNIQKALAAVKASEHADGGLGFRKQRDSIRSRSSVEALIRQHAPTLADDDVERTIKLLDSQEQRAQIRRRFWVQLALSLLIVAFAAYQLHAGVPEGAQKAYFGLLGTVLGFWLR